MEKILFRSTNRRAPEVDFRNALLAGQAPDHGLYLPTAIPRLTSDRLSVFRSSSYAEIAFAVLRPFIPGIIGNDVLRKLVSDAYDFAVPVERTTDTTYIMRLDRGPTASFKDFAARMMARLMNHFARRENRRLSVLVATSGDTGGAVADAFYGLENISVVVLFPEKEVTGRQRRQMTTLGKNITAVAVRGKFDDCQALVKQSFGDPDLAAGNLTSANSINVGRLLPQAVYYFYAWSRVACEDIVFAVPSGNFGNLMGGIFAREMGLPVKKFIVAVNENDEFPNFLKTGEYAPVVPSRECSSNAMNVGHPSNLARLVDLYGGRLTDERDSRGKVLRKGVLIEKPDMEWMRRDFVSFAVSDAEADETIKKYYAEYGVLIEPHGAVALKAVEKAGLQEIVVSLETAHPAKFPEKIRSLLGIEPDAPECLKRLDGREEKYRTIENSYDEFKKLL